MNSVLPSQQVEQYIKRILVEEDVKNPQERNEELFSASADAGNNFYEKGDFAASGIASLESYLLKKVAERETSLSLSCIIHNKAIILLQVGLFPDILERKVKQHFDKGDHVR